MVRSSFRRRQQYRRLCRAVASGVASLTTGVLAVIAEGAGALAVCGRARAHHPRAADRRSPPGAPRRPQPRRSAPGGRGPASPRTPRGRRLAAAPLAALPWARRHRQRVAIAPTGTAFAIETKTRAFDAHHLAGEREMAAWLCRRRRRWCRRGALPVLCVVRARGVERVEDGVLVVSVDRLVASLRAAAGTSPRPAFLASNTVART
jgi:hypothetical protein